MGGWGWWEAEGKLNQVFRHKESAVPLVCDIN